MKNLTPVYLSVGLLLSLPVVTYAQDDDGPARNRIRQEAQIQNQVNDAAAMERQRLRHRLQKEMPADPDAEMDRDRDRDRDRLQDHQDVTQDRIQDRDRLHKDNR